MNLIELEWQQLKTHELGGQMFEDELDLAYAVMDTVGFFPAYLLMFVQLRLGRCAFRAGSLVSRAVLYDPTVHRWCRCPRRQ